VHGNSFTRELVFYCVSRSQSTQPDFENLAYRFQFVAVEIEEPNGSFGQEVYPFLSGSGLGHVSFPSVFLSAQRFGSPAAGFGKATEPKNHLSEKPPLRTHARGGQVEPVLGGKANLDYVKPHSFAF
jgi:hypothetical protein